MDKAQKELIGTYFRKRDIAQKQSPIGYRYKVHEIIYFIDNGVTVDLSKLFSNLKVGLIVKHSELIDGFDLNEFDSYDLSQIVVAHPKLMNRFNLSQLNSGVMISYFPDMVNKFDLNEFNDDGVKISHILRFQPQLIDAVGLNGSKFNLDIIKGFALAKLLEMQPQLINRFDLSGLEDYQIESLLSKQPQLAKYFNK